MNLDKPYPELERNLPSHLEWEGSFYERLAEYGEWNEVAFWKLHLELIDIARNVNLESSVNRQLAYLLLFIQERTLKLIAAHFNINDGFEIRNLSVDSLHEFEERFQMAVIGAVTGEVLPESSFDLENPLMKE